MAGNPGARRIRKSKRPVSGERIAKLRERTWKRFEALEAKAEGLALSADQIMEKHQEIAKIINIIERGNIKELPDAIHKLESDIGKWERDTQDLIARTKGAHDIAKAVGDERLVKQIEGFAIKLGVHRTDIDLVINSIEIFKRQAREMYGIVID